MPLFFSLFAKKPYGGRIDAPPPGPARVKKFNPSDTCSLHPSVSATTKTRTNAWWLAAYQVLFTSVHQYDLEPLPIYPCIEWVENFCTWTGRTVCTSGQLFSWRLKCFARVYQCITLVRVHHVIMVKTKILGSTLLGAAKCLVMKANTFCQFLLHLNVI